MRPWKLVAAWLLALIVTTALTWQIVSFADSQVSAEPVEILPSVGSTTSTTEPSTTNIPPSTISGPSATTSSSSPSSTSPTSGSTSPTSGSTAPVAPPDEWSLRTINTAGGTVVVRYRPDEVELEAATPLPGYEVEIDEAGPARVRVEFSNEESEVDVEVQWVEGVLDVEVSKD